MPCVSSVCVLPWFTLTDSQKSLLFIQEVKDAGAVSILEFTRLWSYRMNKDGVVSSDCRPSPLTYK